MSYIEKFRGYFGLSRNVNKLRDDTTEQPDGVVSDFIEELELDISDDELIQLTKQWEKAWNSYYEPGLKVRQTQNENYWLGLGISEGTELRSILSGGERARPNADNIIFEALETFLPVATRQRPEPVVSADDSEEGMALAKSVEKFLIYHTDVEKIKLKLKDTTRHWALHFLGVMKVGWSENKNDITTKVLRTTDLILDPLSTIEQGTYTGEYIGERKIESASVLVQRFPKMEKFIKREVQGKMGTQLKYTEWWTDDILCWQLKDKILGKIKNPHWNYDPTEEKEIVDDNGVSTFEKIKGNNHFKTRKKPYVFLSVFNMGVRPHDDTNLMEQNIENQEKINRRNAQIEFNIDNINGGWVISRAKSGLNKDQASIAMRNLQKGGGVTIPDGIPSEAFHKITGLSLPGEVYAERQHAEDKLRNIFGVTGLSPQGTSKEQTVRGKIIVRGEDADRIGGGISEYLEQFSDTLYNWLVQLYYVYYTEEHVASIVGGEKGREFVTLKDSDFQGKNLVVSVKEGSMIPKDSLTKHNQAFDLISAGVIDPLTFFQMIELPDPAGALEKLIEWTNFQKGGPPPGAGGIPGEGGQIPPEVSPTGEQVGAGGLVQGSPGGEINQPNTLLSQIPIQ